MKLKTRITGVLVLGTLVAVLAGCGAAKFEAKTTGSDELMDKVKSGQPMYTPPSEAIPQGKAPDTGTTPK